MILVGRTHGIHAEPMTFGLKYLLWYEEMNRNKQRLQDAIDNISIGVISGAVGTYSNIDPQVEVLVCEKLGLKPASISTQIIQRDRHAQYMTTLAIIAASLEKMTLEVRNLQRTDVTEVSEPFGKGQKGSSAMPHKRNPILSERLNGLARVMRGYAMTSLENIALWHERDISHSGAERVIFSDSNILLDYMLHVACRIFSGLEYYPQNMIKNMNVHGGIIFSQRVLLGLIAKGLSREDAYIIVQRNALNARDTEGGDFKKNLLADKEVMEHFSRDDIEQFFDPQATLKNVDLIYDRVLNV
jgi:adenylosuccinate lyase